MQNQMTFSTTSVLLLILGLLIGAGGGYLIINNSLHPVINRLEADIYDLELEVSNLTSSTESLENQIENQKLEIQNLENELNSSLQTIHELEESKAELKNALELAFRNFNETVARIVKFEEENRTESLDLGYNYTLLLMEGFENVPVGALPVKWEKVNGTELDTMYVQSDRAFTGSKSLLLHENGGDGENSRIRLDGFEGCQSLVLDLMYSLEGGFADRGAFQFYGENNQTISTIECLLGVRWEIRQTVGFRVISGLPTPEVGKWYHVEIILDGTIQKIRVIVDGSSSEWLDPLNMWDTVEHMKFRSDSRYPADLYYDDVYVFKIQRENPSLWTIGPDISLDYWTSGGWWYRDYEGGGSHNNSYQESTNALNDVFYSNASDIITENYGNKFVNAYNNTIWVVVKSLEPEVLDAFLEVMDPPPGVSVRFLKGPASWGEVEGWLSIISDELYTFQACGVQVISLSRTENATIRIGIEDITLEKVRIVLEILEGRVPPGILVFTKEDMIEIH